MVSSLLWFQYWKFVETFSTNYQHIDDSSQRYKHFSLSTCLYYHLCRQFQPVHIWIQLQNVQARDDSGLDSQKKLFNVFYTLLIQLLKKNTHNVTLIETIDGNRLECTVTLRILMIVNSELVICSMSHTVEINKTCDQKFEYQH